MDIIQRRRELARVLTEHDASAVKSFLSPAFVVRGADDVITLDCTQLLEQLPGFFKNHPEYKQSVEIESSTVDRDTAKLVTRRVEVLRSLWQSHVISSRWNETWKKFGDEWALAEETPHSPQ